MFWSRESNSMGRDYRGKVWGWVMMADKCRDKGQRGGVSAIHTCLPYKHVCHTHMSAPHTCLPSPFPLCPPPSLPPFLMPPPPPTHLVCSPDCAGCQRLQWTHGQGGLLQDVLEQRIVVEAGLRLTTDLGHHLDTINNMRDCSGPTFGSYLVIANMFVYLYHREREGSGGGRKGEQRHIKQSPCHLFPTQLYYIP